jgi:protoporphyrinogen oxidase
MRTAVLGGGVTGLYLGKFIKDSIVYERSSSVGGLCKTFGYDGFRSDIGPHILFSKDQEALGILLSTLSSRGVQKIYRDSKVIYNGQLIRYPFENGMYELAPEERAALLSGFLDNPHKASAPSNLKEWFLHTFGPEFSERYFLPYNRKIWKRPLESISTEWVGRVPNLSVGDMIRSACGVPTEGHLHQQYFYYPKYGGFETLPRTLGLELGDRLRLDSPVSIQQQEGKWVVNGESYNNIVSTIPILSLLSCLENVPDSVMDAANSLEYNDLSVVQVGVKGTINKCVSACVPGPEVYHRLYHPKRYSVDNTPVGHDSVVCEVVGKVSADSVINDLLAYGVIPDSHQIVHVSEHYEPLAYPVYTHNYLPNIKSVEDYCRGLGIRLAGRLGSHRYINTDGCVRMALDISKELQ